MVDKEKINGENCNSDGFGADENVIDVADNVADESFDTPDNTSEMAEDAREWRDKYMRLSAEFDNFRKRTLKEKMELVAFGGEDIVKAILPVMDDMDRAVEAMDKSDDIESARSGMHLIRQKMIDALRQKGVTEIEADGEPMDVDLHEAVAKFPSEDKKGKVIETVQKGYKLKDKVVRFSKVVVGE